MPLDHKLPGKPAIASLLRPHSRFRRSINLERDFTDPSALEGYVVTQEIQAIVTRVGGGLAPRSTQRAWRVTGDYGAGKSSLGLLLAHLADTGQKPLPKAVRQHLKLKGRLSEGGLLPVLVTGTRAPMRNVIFSALVASVESVARGGRAPAFLRDARKTLESGGPADDREVLDLLGQILADLGRRTPESGGGVLLILDELGKFLEYSLMRPDSQDVYLLQQLAEFACRSGDTPLLLVGLLHQGFGAYVQDSSPDIQREWEKIAGRFEEIVLRPSSAQVMTLVATALNVDRRRIPKAVQSRQEALLTQAVRARLLTGGAHDSEEGVDAVGCYPLTPSVLLVLERLFRRYGHHERSLFSFLFANEPQGLVDFAQRSLGEILRGNDVFDYIRANMAHLLRRQVGSRWTQIEEIVENYAVEDREALEVLKAVGVLNLLDSQGMRATPEVVALVQGATSPAENVRVHRALDRLSAGKVLYRRGGHGDVCLWPYTSLDLGQRYAEASTAVEGLQSVVPELLRILEARPLVGRRHYIETGNLRAMSVDFVAVADSDEALTHEDTTFDAQMVVLLCESKAETEVAETFVRSPAARGNSRVLLGFTRSLKDLASDVQELRRWEWIDQNSPERASDVFAVREISTQLERARSRVRGALDEILGFRRLTGRLHGVDWYYRGKRVVIDSPKQLHQQVSKIFDKLYPKCPRLRNELLNREQLSSAAAAARMRLIERIFSHPEEARLGMDPKRAPPEMSMYLSVLDAAGLHRRQGAGYGFVLPEEGDADPSRLAPIFAGMAEWLERAGDQRRPLTDFLEFLHRPPYGVRSGLVLVLLAVFLAVREQDVALYEDGSFVRRVTGFEFARIAKKPASFEVQHCRIAGIRREVFRRLLLVLGDLRSGGEPKDPHLLDVVRPLMAFVGEISDFARKTQTLSPEALAVRRAIVTAREPGPLLFRALPEALGFPPFEDRSESSEEPVAETINRFVAALEASLEEIRVAYPNLLRRMEEELRQALEVDVESSLQAMRSKLAERTRGLVVAIREPSLRAFCLRLADEGLADEDWLVSLGSTLCAKPPPRWVDADEVRFRDTLGLRAAALKAAESLHFPGAEGGDERAMRLSFTLQDGVQVERVIRMSPGQRRRAQKLRQEIQGLIRGHQHQESLAVLSELVFEALSAEKQGGA